MSKRVEQRPGLYSDTKNTRSFRSSVALERLL